MSISTKCWTLDILCFSKHVYLIIYGCLTTEVLIDDVCFCGVCPRIITGSRKQRGKVRSGMAECCECLTLIRVKERPTAAVLGSGYVHSDRLVSRHVVSQVSTCLCWFVWFFKYRGVLSSVILKKYFKNILSACKHTAPVCLYLCIGVSWCVCVRFCIILITFNMCMKWK